MTEPRFETHTFTVDETSHIFIIEPIRLPVAFGGGEKYSVSHETIRCKSEIQPLLLWGNAIRGQMPLYWDDAISRAKLWKIGLSKLFIGSTLSVRIAIHDGNFMDRPRPRPIRMLQAVHVHNDKPSDEARQWLAEQIAERRGWFYSNDDRPNNTDTENSRPSHSTIKRLLDQSKQGES